MRLSTIVFAGILTGVAGNALACTLPKLFIVPPKDQMAGNEAAVQAAASEYFTGMQAYTACVQAEIAAAGGDSAPRILKAVLVSRNNTAVAEAEFMMKLFTESVGAAAAAGPAAEGPAPAGR